MNKNTWIEISKSSLLHNVKIYQSLYSTVTICPVLKSNAYGHGMELVAKLYQTSNDVSWIAVALLSEALLLRSIGITKKILVLNIIDDDLKEAVLQDITLIAYDLSFVKQLDKLAKKYKKKAHIHIKIDTGLSRAGILASNAYAFITAVKKLSYIALEGVFSHFANSEADDFSFTHTQYQRFVQLLTLLKKNNVIIPYKHIASTAVIPLTQFSKEVTMARLGIGTYGLWPSEENKKLNMQKMPNFFLQPVLTWKTKIIQTKLIPANSYIGYGLTYKTTEAKRIAILPIGYWDGYDRKFSNCGIVKVGTFYAPILGSVCMNLCVIDVTHIPDNQLTHDVILLGKDDKITADALAEKIDTINYEVVTRINPLISRILVD